MKIQLVQFCSINNSKIMALMSPHEYMTYIDIITHHPCIWIKQLLLREDGLNTYIGEAEIICTV